MLPASCPPLQAGSLRSPELLIPKLQLGNALGSSKLCFAASGDQCSPALYSSGQSSTLTAMPSVSIGEIADFVGGQYSGDCLRGIVGVASLTQAASDQLSFLSNRKY